MKIKNKRKNFYKEVGVTLVALVITIVIMLILVGIMFEVSINNKGIIKMAQQASFTWENVTNNEQDIMEDIENSIDEHSTSYNNPNNTEVSVVLNDGSEAVINEDNVDEYMGTPVINIKNNENTENSQDSNNSEELSIGDNIYTVSTIYRLYYIDFDNKYGDGEGTIYLKADYIPNQYECQKDGNIETSKIREFNPSLFAEDVETPNFNTDKMKSAIWLLDTEVWDDLIESIVDEELRENVNYIVGAPSIEMLFDSYNEHYNLTGDTPVKSTQGERVKLFYKFSNENKNRVCCCT